MTADPRSHADQSAGPVASRDTIADPAFLAGPSRTTRTGTAPPHLLWETLESIFAGPPTDAPAPPGLPTREGEPLARYISLPITLALSVVLWVMIVELVIWR